MNTDLQPQPTPTPAYTDPVFKSEVRPDAQPMSAASILRAVAPYLSTSNCAVSDIVRALSLARSREAIVLPPLNSETVIMIEQHYAALIAKDRMRYAAAKQTAALHRARRYQVFIVKDTPSYVEARILLVDGLPGQYQHSYFRSVTAPSRVLTDAERLSAIVQWEALARDLSAD